MAGVLVVLESGLGMDRVALTQAADTPYMTSVTRNMAIEAVI
jgi:hypothetical protein